MSRSVLMSTCRSIVDEVKIGPCVTGAGRGGAVLDRTAKLPTLPPTRRRAFRVAQSTPPFSRFEFMIAWRYLRARRADGGVSVMTWISFLGIMLAVMALIATLAVRSGFRYEFVGTILGANPHISVYDQVEVMDNGRTERVLEDYAQVAEAVAG